MRARTRTTLKVTESGSGNGRVKGIDDATIESEIVGASGWK